MPLFLFIFDFITYIHSFNHNTFIRSHSLKPLSISSSLVCSVGKTSLWCMAENRTRACLTASRLAANWATPHHNEPCRTILSHAAPCYYYSLAFSVKWWNFFIQNFSLLIPFSRNFFHLAKQYTRNLTTTKLRVFTRLLNQKGGQTNFIVALLPQTKI
jgi:hypothetical protein